MYAFLMSPSKMSTTDIPWVLGSESTFGGIWSHAQEIIQRCLHGHCLNGRSLRICADRRKRLTLGEKGRKEMTGVGGETTRPLDARRVGILRTCIEPKFVP